MALYYKYLGGIKMGVINNDTSLIPNTSARWLATKGRSATRWDADPTVCQAMYGISTRATS